MFQTAKKKQEDEDAKRRAAELEQKKKVEERQSAANAEKEKRRKEKVGSAPFFRHIITAQTLTANFVLSIHFVKFGVTLLMARQEEAEREANRKALEEKK
jgi:hypothetical protein